MGKGFFSLRSKWLMRNEGKIYIIVCDSRIIMHNPNFSVDLEDKIKEINNNYTKNKIIKQTKDKWIKIIAEDSLIIW